MGAVAVVLAAVVAVVVSAAVAAVVVLMAAAEDQGQPLVGSLVGLHGDDGSLQIQSTFWQPLAIIWRPF